jgi:hypothetical protein
MAIEEMLQAGLGGDDSGGITASGFAFVEPLVQRLFALKDRGPALHGAALSTLAALARAVEDEFLPFYTTIVEHLLGVLESAAAAVVGAGGGGEDDDGPAYDFDLCVRAVDALGCLATAMSSPSHFAPYADTAARIAVGVIASGDDDPEVRAGAFLLLGSVAQVTNVPCFHIFTSILIH